MLQSEPLFGGEGGSFILFCAGRLVREVGWDVKGLPLPPRAGLGLVWHTEAGAVQRGKRWGYSGGGGGEVTPSLAACSWGGGCWVF